MADFDKIVRPFQIKPNAAAIPERVLEIRKPGTPITHRSGENGKGKIISGSYSLEAKFFHQDTVLELPKKR